MDLMFTKEKETKNAVRFREEGSPEAHKVGAIYLKKTAVSELGGGEDTEAIKITIKAA